MKLRYTPATLADLAAVLDYIAERSPRGAKRVQRRIEHVIALLSAHPRIGVRTDEPTIRRLTTTPYPFLVFYEVLPDEIIIHAIKHAAHDPSGMPGSE